VWGRTCKFPTFCLCCPLFFFFSSFSSFPTFFIPCCLFSPLSSSPPRIQILRREFGLPPPSLPSASLAVGKVAVAAVCVQGVHGGPREIFFFCRFLHSFFFGVCPLPYGPGAGTPRLFVEGSPFFLEDGCGLFLFFRTFDKSVVLFLCTFQTR